MLGFGVFLLITSATFSTMWDLGLIHKVWKWVKL